jgi:hypothetical protein
MRTWTRGPQPGEPCRDVTNDRIGRVTQYMPTQGVVALRDRDGEWHAALEETEPASEEEYDGQMAGH